MASHETLRWDGRVGVVTGGGGGIGLAIAQRIADGGGSVVIGDLNAERGTEAVASLGDQARFVRHLIGMV